MELNIKVNIDYIVSSFWRLTRYLLLEKVLTIFSNRSMNSTLVAWQNGRWTCDVEYHVLVSRGRAGQVTAVDARVLAPSSPNDEYGQCAVVRSVDAIATIVDRHVLPGRYTHGSRLRRSAPRPLLNPVDLPHNVTAMRSPHNDRALPLDPIRGLPSAGA